ncbi:MAG: DNA ligase (NAD(+)) LigA, partial [bacterium]|nr:DNA ligase (NAD(+)) LigA [bacterium]
TAATSDLIENGYNTIDKIIEAATAGDVETFSGIEGFGEITAQLLIEHFTDKQNLEMIAALRDAGLNFVEEVAEVKKPESQDFAGQVWVITGSFENYNPRTMAAEEIKKRGGKVTGSVSSKTTHLLAGSAAGSKLKKAEKLDIPIINEKAFIEML